MPCHDNQGKLMAAQQPMHASNSTVLFEDMSRLQIVPLLHITRLIPHPTVTSNRVAAQRKQKRQHRHLLVHDAAAAAPPVRPTSKLALMALSISSTASCTMSSSMHSCFPASNSRSTDCARPAVRESAHQQHTVVKVNKV